MSSYDKYDPFDGGFRAALAAAMDGTSANQVRYKLYGVGLNASGQVVVGAGVSGIKGVFICHNKKLRAGEIVDVMTDGEVVNFGETDVSGTFTPTAGTNYYAAANGVVSTTNTGVYIGHTVEARRLIVRVNTANAAA